MGLVTTAAATHGDSPMLMPSPLQDKIVVITGANSGIGLVVALALAERSARVVLACRSRERGQEALEAIRKRTTTDAGGVELLLVDMADLESIRSFARAFHARYGRLDILINNAGVMHPPETHTADGFEAHFGVNHLGHFYLTSLLFDALKRSPAARIVNVSSLIHRFATADLSDVGYTSTASRWRVMNDYSVSKLCNLLFTYELDRRLVAAGIRNVLVVACHPGITLTNISPSAIHARHLPTWMQRGLAWILRALPIFQSAEMGAMPTLFAAVAPGVQGGEFFGPGGWQGCWGFPVREISSTRSYSEEDAEALWRRSEELLKCAFLVR